MNHRLVSFLSQGWASPRFPPTDHMMQVKCYWKMENNSLDVQNKLKEVQIVLTSMTFQQKCGHWPTKKILFNLEYIDEMQKKRLHCVSTWLEQSNNQTPTKNQRHQYKCGSKQPQQMLRRAWKTIKMIRNEHSIYQCI